MTDKGEVGGSSPPRPTIKPFKINTFRGFLELFDCQLKKTHNNTLGCV